MRKKIKDIGELALIRKLTSRVKTDSSVITGIGDDAAVIKSSAGEYLLFKTDMIIEGEHFTKDMPSRLIGHKALARNISDIAAMGGIPTHAVISMAMPGSTSVGFAENIFAGINQLAKDFDINIVGGDTCRAEKIFISIALLGKVRKTDLVLRSGAKRGDLIFVTGHLGASFKTRKHLEFIPRLKEAQFLVKNFKPAAMIDVSDGLVLDLYRILESSKVGAVIHEEFIPLSKGAALKDALYEGEDYELLFTLPYRKAFEFINVFKNKQNKLPLSCIGEIDYRKYGLNLVDKKYKIRKLEPKGFTHF